jgi:hypothetical protein
MTTVNNLSILSADFHGFNPPVIASGAKQSRVNVLPGWIASPLRCSQ